MMAKRLLLALLFAGAAVPVFPAEPHLVLPSSQDFSGPSALLTEVWGASVDGNPEKPAIADSGGKKGSKEQSVLIKIINSAQGFPVTLIYATPVAKIRALGKIGAMLPQAITVQAEPGRRMRALPNGMQ